MFNSNLIIYKCIQKIHQPNKETTSKNQNMYNRSITFKVLF